MKTPTFSSLPLELVPVVALAFVVEARIAALVVAGIRAIIIVALFGVALGARLFVDVGLEFRLGFRLILGFTLQRISQKAASIRSRESHLFSSSATQERPATLLEELVGVVIDRLHDRAPVQVDWTFSERNVDGAEVMVSHGMPEGNTKRTRASS